MRSFDDITKGLQGKPSTPAEQAEIERRQYGERTAARPESRPLERPTERQPIAGEVWVLRNPAAWQDQRLAGCEVAVNVAADGYVGYRIISPKGVAISGVMPMADFMVHHMWTDSGKAGQRDGR